jgi:hypothetical protein
MGVSALVNELFSAIRNQPTFKPIHFFLAYNQLYLTRYYQVKLLIKQINYIQIDKQLETNPHSNQFIFFSYNQLYLTQYYLVKLLIKQINYIPIDKKNFKAKMY